MKITRAEFPHPLMPARMPLLDNQRCPSRHAWEALLSTLTIHRKVPIVTADKKRGIRVQIEAVRERLLELRPDLGEVFGHQDVVVDEALKL